MKPTQGNRKSNRTREANLLLVLMFCVAAWMKVDANICIVFVGGIVGANSAFMWGNAQEHKAATGQIASTVDKPAGQ